MAGLVFGPKQFITCTEAVADLFKRHHITHHQSADYLQTIGHGSASSVRNIASTIHECIIDVQSWCSSKRLQLNAGKTEITWFGTTTNLRRLNVDDQRITINSTIIEPSSVIRDLSIYFDAELSMRGHVIRIAQTCFHHLRRLCSIRRLLGQDVAAQLVSALVLTRISYCNVVLADLPYVTLRTLQSVINAAERLVLDL
jgi:hypothetical protein